MDGQTEKQLLEAVKELLKWVKIQTQPAARATLEAALPEASHRKLYQALDGNRTQKQLAEILGASQPTVSRLITAWMRAGIVEEAAPGRYARSFDLVSLGIDLKPPKE